MLSRENFYTNDRNEKWEYRCVLPHDKPLTYCVQVHGFSSTIDSDYVINGERGITGIGMAAVAFNLTGASRKGVKTHNLTPDNALNDMRHFMTQIKADDTLNHDRPAILGTSFGAYTSVRYAAEKCRMNPDNPGIGHLVLQCTVPNPIKPFRERVERSAMGIQYNKILWKMVGYMPQMIAGDLCWISYKMYSESKNVDLYTLARDVTCPVTIIHADRDELAPLDDIYPLRDAFVNAKSVNLHVVPNAGHQFTANQMNLARDFFQDAMRITYPDLKKPDSDAPQLRLA